MAASSTFDFDAPCDRTGTGSLKFDCHAARGKATDLMSLWVADMDFPTAPAVTEALIARAQHGVFGYTEPTASYFDAVEGWMRDRYGWQTDRRHYTLTPGVVFALAMAVRAFTEPGDAVVIQQPVYYPFSEAVLDNSRELVNVPLVYDAEQARYQTDVAAFEQAVVEKNVKLFLLCNPHNPGGRVWTPEELRGLGEVCVRHGVTVVSDEIHMDFARPGYTHTVFASLDERFAQISATCTSAGKTFNLASLQLSNIVIPNADLRKRFRNEVGRAGYSQPNAMGLAATEAAYTQGGPWLEALKEYLEGNWALVREHLAANAPELRLVEPGSTYLAWIDCRALGLDAAGIKELVEDEARLWLDLGDMFGADGTGFIRINLATQRAYLQKALTHLTSAVVKRRG